MTRFFCQELLFEYATGQLTAERAQEIADYLATDELCREDLANLKKAIGFCGKLGRSQPPTEWVERWRNLPPALAKRLSNLETQLIGRLWTALPYIVSITMVSLAVIIFRPWRLMNAQDVVVWSSPASPANPVSIPGHVNEETPPSTPVATAPPPAPVAVPAPPPPPPPTPTVNAAAAATPPAKTAAQEPDKAQKPFSEEDVQAEEDNPIAPSNLKGGTKEKLKQDQMRGEIYLGSLAVEDLDEATDLVKAKIVELGGEKARKVELGWRRKEGESYFHFTLPESNLGPLTQFLKSFGPVRISKQKHPVVMPQGKIRIILVVNDTEDNGDNAEDTTAP